MRTALLLLLAAVAVAAEPVTALGTPNRLELYLDGIRLVHAVPVAAGRTRIPMPVTAGELVQVDGADGWVAELRIDSAEVPPMPPILAELAALVADLDRQEQVLSGQEAAAEGMAAELALRLGQRAVTPGDESGSWQASLDGLIALRSGLAERRLALAAAWRELRDHASAKVATGLTLAEILGLDQEPRSIDFSDTAAGAQRAWRSALERSAIARTLVVERAQAGTVTVVTERTDVRWSPRSRLIAGKGAATLVRQAAVLVPAGLILPTAPARMVGGTRAQPLAGAGLTPRVVTAGNAPVADRRSVTTTTRAAGWAEGSGTAAAREQTWELPALTLAAPGELPAEVMAELQKGPVELVTDEWVMAPDLAPVLVRRLSVRLDTQPLAAGTLELVVDGAVLGRRELPATAPGSVIHLAAGEDQRIFLAETRRWDEDPNRPVNRKREGNDFRLRNLSGEAVRFICYLTRPVSAAKGVTVTMDGATTAGWKEPQPGILRWELALKPGEELKLSRGWVIEAEGKIKL